MRSGASTVQQTLTPEAATILKHAVAEACRRGHAQATPLHVAATLIGAPGSPLRRACLNTHPHPPHPLQCRALELCFNVALDRLQAAQGPLPGGQPSYSNALVAALKRAQAHQRRGYPEQQQQPLLAVKVELEQLVISILDDPSVSRVMREAGFSSTDVKNHLEDMVSLMSPHHAVATPSNQDQVRFSLGATVDHFGLRLNAAPTFLGNIALSQHLPQHSSFTLERNDTQLRLRPPRASLYMSPRMHGLAGGEISATAGDDVKRVFELLMRRKRNNPVLIGETGMCTETVIRGLMNRIDRCDVPEQLRGVKFFSAQLSLHTVGTATREELEVKFSELNKIVEGLLPGGAIIHIGDLQWTLESSQPRGAALGSLSFCPVKYVMNELMQLLARHGNGGRLWLIGTATCQTYVRCQVHHPSMEGQWELQPVPISLSLQPRFKSQELQSTAIDAPLVLDARLPSVVPLKSSSTKEDGPENLNCCSECISKYERELVLLREQERGAHSDSPQSCSSSLETSSKDLDSEMKSKSMSASQPVLPLWLQQAIPSKSAIDSENVKTKGVITLDQKLRELRKKWNHTCHTLHAHQHLTRSNISSEQLQQPSPSSSQASGGTSTDGKLNAQEMSDSVKGANGYVHELQLFGNGKQSGAPGSWWLSSACQPRSSIPSLSPVPSSWNGNLGRRSFELGAQQESSVSLLRKNNPSRGDSCKPIIINDSIPSLGTDLSLGRPSLGIASISSPNGPSEHHQQTSAHNQRLQDQVGCSPSSPSRPSEHHQQMNAHNQRLQNQAGCSPSRVGLTWQNFSARVPVSPSTDADPPDRHFERGQYNNKSTGLFRQMDSDAFKRLYKGLVERVGWQKEAISAIANTVIQCRSGVNKRHGVNLKGDTWLLLLGPDQLGKRKIAQALAEVIFGSEKKLSCIGLGRQIVLSSPSVWSLGFQELDVHGGSLRGRLPLDRLAETVRLNPFSVVLLEDVDQCDSVLKNRLIQAMEKGRLLDSGGREVNFGNVIVVMTSSVGADYLDPYNRKKQMQFTENRLAVIPGTGLRLLVDDVKSERALCRTAANLVIVDHGYVEEASGHDQSSASLSKRKANWDIEEVGANLTKKPNQEKNIGQALALDLNLSADENEAGDTCGGCDSFFKKFTTEENKCDEVGEEQVLYHARKYIKEFCDFADAAVIFRPFDFESLTGTVINSINEVISSRVTPGTIEIDVKVLEQVIAAVWWVPCGKQTLEKWTKEVLEQSLSILLANCRISPSSILKLLPEECVSQQQLAALRLPTRISVDFGASLTQEHL